MLKMHIFHFIPTLLDDTLVVDADLRFVKPRTMVDCNRRASYVRKMETREHAGMNYIAMVFEVIYTFFIFLY